MRWGSEFRGPSFRGGRGHRRAHQVQLASIEQFPLDRFARFQPNRRRQRQRETHIQPRLLPLGAARLNLQRIGGVSGCLLVYFTCHKLDYSPSFAIVQFNSFPSAAPAPPAHHRGNVDYREFERQLRRIDSLLLAQPAWKTQFITASVDHWRAKKQPDASNITPRQQTQIFKTTPAAPSAAISSAPSCNWGYRN